MIEHKVRRFNAGDILDQRCDLIDRMVTNEKFREIIINVMATSPKIARKDNTIASLSGLPVDRNEISFLPDLVAKHLRNASGYRVSADMVTLLEHAATLLDNTDQFSSTLLPTAAGFVRFDRPLTVMDVRGKEMLIHALTWGPIPIKYDKNDEQVRISTLVTMWNDVDVETDVYSDDIVKTYGARIRKICGRWSYVGAEILFDDVRIGPAMIDPTYVKIKDDTAQPFTNSSRYVLALCMLMNQTIVSTSAERPHARARARAKQRKVPISDVTVITLRRTTTKSHDGNDDELNHVDWHHRWVVRGHWRWQPVGPGRKQVKRVWVAGYVKGPEDKPLVVKHKIYDLKR